MSGDIAFQTAAPSQKILILGASGLLGTALVHVLRAAGHHIDAPPRALLDATDPAALARRTADAAYVINAAYAKGAGAGDPAHARAINVTLPHILAAQCRASGARLIQISSDGVFAGNAAPYDESRAPDASDPYGSDKIAGEPAGALILRSSVIGPEQRGFNALFCWLMGQSGPIAGFDNHLWNGLSSLAYARAIATIITGDLWLAGVRHIFSAPALSKCDLLHALARATGKEIAITAKAAAQPRDLRLSTRHPEFYAALNIPPLGAQLAELAGFTDETGRWRVPAAG